MKLTLFAFLFAILILCLQSNSEIVHDGNLQGNSTNFSTDRFGRLSCLQNDEFGAAFMTTEDGLGFVLGCTVMIPVALVSLFCNFLIIHVIRVNPSMHSTTNYVIANMAAGDFLATLFVTFWTVKCYANGAEWKGSVVFGEYIYCRLGCPLYYVFMLVSIFSLLAISFDRFMAVIRPLKYKTHSSWTKSTIFAIWAISFAIPAHYALTKISFCHNNGSYYCTSRKSPFDAVLMISAGFVIPLSAVSILYFAIIYKLCTRTVPGSRSSKVNSGQIAAQQVAKKVTHMVICILFAFEACWSPMFIGYVFPLLSLGTADMEDKKVLLFKLLMISNGLFNFLIYIKFNDNFRVAFKEAVLCNSSLGRFRRRLRSLISTAGRSLRKQESSMSEVELQLDK